MATTTVFVGSGDVATSFQGNSRLRNDSCNKLPSLGHKPGGDSVEPQPYKLLFLCTGNSARSILGEYLLKRIGGPRFNVYSAGSFPTGKVNPYALRILNDIYHIDASTARSKSWEEFGDIEFDFVITVCDNARESCPIWPGQPIVAHWASPDPALVQGSDEKIHQAFRQVALQMQRRIELFTSLPLEKLDRLKLQRLSEEIGGKEILLIE
jgi:arsenate reductase